MLFTSLLAMVLHFWRLVEEAGLWNSQKKRDLWVLQQLLVLHQLPIVVELVSSLSILGDHLWCDEFLASMCL
jgi:hypothetical protein